MISDPTLHSSVFSHARDDCNHLFKTFGEIYQAVRRSGCKVDSIKLDTFSVVKPYIDVAHHERQVQHTMHHLLGWLCRTLSFELKLERIIPHKPRYHLKYDHDTGGLDLAGLIFDQTPEPSFIVVGIELLLLRLSARSLTQIRLKDCWFEKSDLS